LQLNLPYTFLGYIQCFSTNKPKKLDKPIKPKIMEDSIVFILELPFKLFVFSHIYLFRLNRLYPDLEKTLFHVKKSYPGFEATLLQVKKCFQDRFPIKEKALFDNSAGYHINP
jgi:hypothetical protein